jgi:primosomal protein N'
LNLGDYRAVERTFQTIVQVAGRAGREAEKGRVIIQTYNPDSYAIVDAKEQNYDKFYRRRNWIKKSVEISAILRYNISQIFRNGFKRNNKGITVFL